MNGATFTVEASELWRVLGNAAVAAGKDGTLPVLNSVQVTIGAPDDSSESTVVAAATDRYLLLTDSCKCIGVTEAVTFLLPMADWQRLDKLLKGVRYGYAVATVEDGTRVRWDMPDGTAMITTCLDAEFPRWRMLIPDVDVAVNLDAPIGFNRDFLARLAKLRVNRTAPLRMTCTHAAKAVRVDVGESVYGVIMPTRLG